jgi:hypothetical protein
MRYLAALPLPLGLSSTALANTFRLECVDTSDGKTRVALIEINTDAASVKIPQRRAPRPSTNLTVGDSPLFP